MEVPQPWVEAIADYLASQRAAGYPLTTRNTRQQHLQHLARHIDLPPWTITADQLVAFCGEQEWAASTRRSRRTTFQSFFGWAKETKRRKGNPSRALKKVRQPSPSPRPVPKRIYAEALMRADELERIWMELAHDFGMRRAEIAQVHISRDIFEDFVGHSIIVHGKGNKDRVVPLTPTMARTLLDRGDSWLCDGDERGHISARWLGKRVNRLLEGSWTIHSLRHSAGTRWNRHGGLLVAQRLLGHASVATTQVYCAVDDDELRATVLASAS